MKKSDTAPQSPTHNPQNLASNTNCPTKMLCGIMVTKNDALILKIKEM